MTHTTPENSTDDAAHTIHHPRRLSADLRDVLTHADGKPITIGELVDVLRERGLAVVLMILALPFLIPVPTMGLSAPIGLAIAVYGVMVMAQMKPWIPKFLARRTLSFATLTKLVDASTRFITPVEKMLRPRLRFMLWPGVNVLIGLSLAFAGFFLALPLPIPFTNAIPAVAILLILAGLIERDGVFVIAGQIVCVIIFAICVVVLYLLWQYGWAGVQSITQSWTGSSPTTTTTGPVR